jgi:hypothetical protein
MGPMGGLDAMVDEEPPVVGPIDVEGGVPDGAPIDATSNPFEFDSSGDFNPVTPDPAALPADWSCPEAIWNDGHCDCGCTATDVDCQQFSCKEPGCTDERCDACYSIQGSWKPCTADPDLDRWLCSPSALTNGTCDCGCGEPDPACGTGGCTEPGCRKPECTYRHGCNQNTTAAEDACSSVVPLPDPVPTTWACTDDGSPVDCRCQCDDKQPPSTWECATNHYGSGDGCHCGCGAHDPDCGSIALGCTSKRCYSDACDFCAFGDAPRRPYSCEAAQAGWDEDVTDGTGGLDPSRCNGTRFGAGDGCDCGCGGIDPDCGTGGCADPGCAEASCDRCTDAVTRDAVGCAANVDRSTWETNACSLANYGTGDGCDCGCGAPDPDCPDALGAVSFAGVLTCDVCHDGTGGYQLCDGWRSQCAGPAFATADCDCGCGVIDPACRDFSRLSCTAADCELATCQYCNDASGNRVACGGDWSDGVGSDGCTLEMHGLDGLCDCGCGAADPDCAQGEGCTAKGCEAPGCEVCHNGTLLIPCRAWTCAAAAFGDGSTCDCGCGSPDPDCGSDGCEEPGCHDTACEACHDPFGRVTVSCP